MLTCGRTFDGKYQIVQELGRGGMGHVFKAFHRELGRYVALKVLSLSNISDDAVRRLEREAQALSQLHHNSIVAVYGFGFAESIPYLVMEFVEGETLESEFLDDRPLPVEQTVSIMLQLCDAIDYTHRNGIIHRDLKPENVMITSREGKFKIKLIDLGLARIIPDAGRNLQKITETGTALGTAIYMSPEQCTGEQADERSDIYSLGVIMFRCLTARFPFDAASDVALMRMHITEEPPALTDFLPQLNIPGLQSIINRCLAKEPSRRYSSVCELAADLEKVNAGQGGQVSELQPLYSAPSHRARVLWIVGCLCASITFGGALVGLALFHPKMSSKAVYQRALEEGQSPQTFVQSLFALQEAFDLNAHDHLIDSVRPDHDQIEALMFYYLDREDPRAVPLVRMFVEKNVPVVETRPTVMTYYHLQNRLINNDDDLGSIRKRIKTIQGWRLVLEGARNEQCNWFGRGQLLQMVPLDSPALVAEMEKFLAEDARLSASADEVDVSEIVEFGRTSSDLSSTLDDQQNRLAGGHWRYKKKNTRHTSKLKLDVPDLAMIHLNLFRYYLRAGQTAVARAHLETAYGNAIAWTTYEKTAYILDAVAIALAELKDWPKMVACMQLSQKYCPDVFNRDDAAYPLSILALEKAGRHSDAQKLYLNWRRTFSPTSIYSENDYVAEVENILQSTGYTFYLDGTRRQLSKLGS